MAKPNIIQTADGRVFVRTGKPHPLSRSGAVKLLSAEELSRIPGSEYAAPSTPYPAEQGVPTFLPQSALAPVPRSVLDQNRRVAYPVRTKETAAYQRSLTPEEYIHKKTFERPAFFAIEDPIQVASPWLDSVLLPGPSGTPVTGNLKIDAAADFEVVKIMVLGRKLVDQAWVATKNFLIQFKDVASGREFSNRPIHAENFGGSANEPLILPVTLFINRNVSVQVTFINVEPVSTSIYIYFTLLGIKYFYRDVLNLTTGIPEQGEYKRV